MINASFSQRSKSSSQFKVVNSDMSLPVVFFVDEALVGAIRFIISSL